jgi:hypothetical protein
MVSMLAEDCTPNMRKRTGKRRVGGAIVKDGAAASGFTRRD